MIIPCDIRKIGALPVQWPINGNLKPSMQTEGQIKLLPKKLPELQLQLPVEVYVSLWKAFCADDYMTELLCCVCCAVVCEHYEASKKSIARQLDSHLPTFISWLMKTSCLALAG